MATKEEIINDVLKEYKTQVETNFGIKVSGYIKQIEREQRDILAHEVQIVYMKKQIRELMFEPFDDAILAGE